MMKKVISLFLAAALCASLTGCGLGAKQAAKVSSGKGAELALGRTCKIFGGIRHYP